MKYKAGKLDSPTFNLSLLLVFFSMKVGRNEQVVCSLRHLKGFLNIEAHEFKDLPLAAIFWRYQQSGGTKVKLPAASLQAKIL